MSSPDDINDDELLKNAAAIFETWELSSMSTGFLPTVKVWLLTYAQRQRRSTEEKAAMVLADLFARKALEGVGKPIDALHAIRDVLEPWITPLKDEDIAIVGGEISPREKKDTSS